MTFHLSFSASVALRPYLALEELLGSAYNVEELVASERNNMVRQWYLDNYCPTCLYKDLPLRDRHSFEKIHRVRPVENEHILDLQCVVRVSVHSLVMSIDSPNRSETWFRETTNARHRKETIWELMISTRC
jgi:hypothetical protein